MPHQFKSSLILTLGFSWRPLGHQDKMYAVAILGLCGLDDTETLKTAKDLAKRNNYEFCGAFQLDRPYVDEEIQKWIMSKAMNKTEAMDIVASIFNKLTGHVSLLE